jgi:hypothetical protein
VSDDQERWLASVIRRRSVVITAAHCLPRLPPPHGSACLEEKTYTKVLGPLGEEPTVWAECLFADPVADLAVLGEPDGQELYNENERYEALVEDRALPIAPVPLVRPQIALPDGQAIPGRPKWHGRAWLLSLEGRWCGVDVHASWSSLWLENAEEPIRRGMSGSPIMSLDGAAIGILCLSWVRGGSGRDPIDPGDSFGGGPNPFLWQRLPRWILQDEAQP